jgi:hypothetical protein
LGWKSPMSHPVLAWKLSDVRCWACGWCLSAPAPQVSGGSGRTIQRHPADGEARYQLRWWAVLTQQRPTC